MEKKGNKTIHYCWFGRGKKPAIVEKCINTWSKTCPDFEITEWNEDNFDVDICPYVKQAYDAKKYAFVSDYARFFVLNKYGGVYLDTDVELIKNVGSLAEKNFVGFESPLSVNTGLIMACEKDNALCKDMLEEYDRDIFVKEDGSLNLRTVCERVTDWFVDRGLILNGQTQMIGGFTVYASEYFNPVDMKSGKKHITDNTYSIHHYAASWVKKSAKIRGKIYQLLVRLFGEKFAERVRNIINK